MRRRVVAGEGGFTMIELLVAMSVFSFMLLIIVVGFINIVRMHNQALASGVAQDNARVMMDELVRGVRDSAGVTSPAPGIPSATLCLANASGPQQYYYVNAGTLFRGDGCTAPANVRALSSSAVSVTSFVATVESAGAEIVKPEVKLALTVASNNGTTTGSGAGVRCGPTNAERTFCAVITLTSGAVPR
jgi:prepilin-type N-terminal cleavage/methylation domain-containing protein